jgi:hypothetical protein
MDKRSCSRAAGGRLVIVPSIVVDRFPLTVWQVAADECFHLDER